MCQMVMTVPGVVNKACKAAFSGGIQKLVTIQRNNILVLHTCTKSLQIISTETGGSPTNPNYPFL